MRYEKDEMEMQAAIQTAARMCAAARTAPKAHGKDALHTYVLTGEDKEALARKMEEVGLREMGGEMPTWYGRDAANVRRSNAVVLIGADKKQRGVPHCGYCGHGDCAGCRALRLCICRPRNRGILGGKHRCGGYDRLPHHVFDRQNRGGDEL